MRIGFTVFLSIGVLSVFACSTLNQSYQDDYRSKHNVRHGIVPVEPPAADQKGSAKKGDLVLASDPKSIERGKALYGKHCLECHGASGQGNGPLASNQNQKPVDLKKTVSEVPHFKFFMSVSQMQGAEKMPGWKTVFSQNDLNDLVAYLRTL